MAMKYTTRGPLKPVGRPDAGFFVDGDGLLCTFDGRFVRDIFSRRESATRAGIPVTGHRGGLIVDAHVPERERLDDGEPQPERRGRPLSEWQEVHPVPARRCSGCGKDAAPSTALHPEQRCARCWAKLGTGAYRVVNLSFYEKSEPKGCTGCGRPLLTHGGAPVPCCCGADNPTNPAAVHVGTATFDLDAMAIPPFVRPRNCYCNTVLASPPSQEEN